jgi:hypothetical protein
MKTCNTGTPGNFYGMPVIQMQPESNLDRQSMVGSIIHSSKTGAKVVIIAMRFTLAYK